MPSANPPTKEQIRRPNPIIELGPQTLACHSAFWKRIVPPETRSDRLEAINKELEKIHTACGDRFVQGFDDKKVYDIVKTDWNSIPVTLGYMLHEELISSIYYIHVDKAGDAMRNIVSTLRQYFADIMTVAAGGGSCTDLLTCHKFLFEDVWTAFFNDKKAIPQPCPSWPFGSALANPRIIANFRGLIIGNMVSTSGNKNEIDNGVNQRIANTLLPFLCCSENPNLNAFSVCTMKGYSAWHASTLGETSGAHAQGTHRYLLYSHSLPPMDLGELLNRGHRAGIYRLAAISLLPNLDEARDLLRQIEGKIDGTFRLLSAHGWDINIQNNIHDIAFGDFPRLNEKFDPNIRDRLDQSSWYKNKFHTLIGKLDIRPLGGYKSFLTVTNEFIESTLERAARLLQYYDRVIEQYRTLCNLAGVEETAERNAKIVDLQVNAEIVLFIALIPYYMPNIVTHTVRALFSLDEHEHHLVDKLSWPIFLVFGIWLTLNSLAERKPLTPAGKTARQILQAVEQIRHAIWRWLKLSRHPNVLLVLPVVFAAIWAYAVKHFHIPERLFG